MNYKPILIVPGDPDSIFFEIFFKTLKKKTNKKSSYFNIVTQPSKKKY